MNRENGVMGVLRAAQKGQNFKAGQALQEGFERFFDFQKRCAVEGGFVIGQLPKDSKILYLTLKIGNLPMLALELAELGAF